MRDLAQRLAETNAILQEAFAESARREEALRNSEALYQSLVETLPVCIFRKDLDGRFTFGNRTFCERLKKPLSEIIGKTDPDFYPRELAHKYICDDRHVMETGDVLEVIEEHRCRARGRPTSRS